VQIIFFVIASEVIHLSERELWIASLRSQ